MFKVYCDWCEKELPMNSDGAFHHVIVVKSRQRHACCACAHAIQQKTIARNKPFIDDDNDQPEE